MKAIALFFIALIFSAQSFAIGMGERPLRTLKVGSEIYLAVVAQFMTDGFYQEGTQVIPHISMDENTPYCHIDLLSTIPPFSERETPMQLIKTEGVRYDIGENDPWPKFRTSLSFVKKGSIYEFTINCFSSSAGLFKEMTLDELSVVFGDKIRFGNVDLDDHGIEKRDPLSPQHDVLTPSLLRKSILVEIGEELTLETPKDDSLSWPEIHVVGGVATMTNEYTKPYCSLFVVSKDGSIPKTVTIPANTKLRFEGDIVGDYVREDGLDSGFTTMGDLKGFKYPLRLLCNSGDVAKPFRYGNMRKTTAPVIDWAYTN